MNKVKKKNFLYFLFTFDFKVCLFVSIIYLYI